MTRLADKVILITGGTKGIGLAIAEHAMREGAAVVITGRDPQCGLDAARALGGNALYLNQDVTDEAAWDGVMEKVCRRFGHLDALVNNAGTAGISETQDPEGLALDEWRQIMETNLDSVFLGCRAAIGAMKANGGGSIVNMSSTAGLMSTPAFVAYGAAKAGVAHLTKSVAVHCARKGYNIRCNSVHPALIDTPMSDQILHFFGSDLDTSRASYLSRVPLGALGTPDDVASAVMYLASDESRYVTGTQLVVGGGLGV